MKAVAREYLRAPRRCGNLYIGQQTSFFGTAKARALTPELFAFVGRAFPSRG